METKQNDELQKEAIRKICEERNITELVHFTHIDNLSSILYLGLMTREELDESGITYRITDDKRLDGYPEAVSLSISFPNYKMFHNKSYGQKEKWVVLSLFPKILWEFNCAFFPDNAARSNLRRTPIKQLKTVESFMDLFSEKDNKRSSDLPSYYPTNPQAEVLVFNNIPSFYIREIYFCDDGTRDEWCRSLSGGQWELIEDIGFIFTGNKKYFLPREDYSNW